VSSTSATFQLTGARVERRANDAAIPADIPQPHNAIVAVTLNCNARCQMCDIWQNDMHNEAPPELFGRLLIFVGLAEGIAIYGLIVSILILNRLT